MSAKFFRIQADQAGVHHHIFQSGYGLRIIVGQDATNAFDANDFRSTLPRFQADAMTANLAMVELLKTIGEEKNASPAQIALGWLLAQHEWIVPIPGTTKLSRLEENIASENIELTKDDLEKIAEAAANINIVGERYNVATQKLVTR